MPILTLAQVKQGLEVYAKAAQILVEECPGQAAARAYYQIHFVAQQVALLLGPPFESVRNGKAIGRLNHVDVPQVVSKVCERQIAGGQSLPTPLTADNAYAYADGLVKARMEADYRPYQAFSKERARTLLIYAGAIKALLLQEVEFARIQTKASQGTPKGATP